MVDDLSVYIVGGRADPGVATAQAIEAERLGFRRAWFCERLNLKDAGVLLGAIGASTTRIGIGTAPVTVMARSPVVTASLGATVHAVAGPRLALGVGRGPADWIKVYGTPHSTYSEMIEYLDAVRRLWRGEKVSYEGPGGSFSDVIFADRYDGPPPEVWYAHLGGPRASKVSANPVIDGVMLGAPMTPEAVARSVAVTREECERTGRDPAGVRICVGVCTAPSVETLGEDARAAMANPAYGPAGYVTPDALKAYIALAVQTKQCHEPGGMMERNGWHRKDIDALVNHPGLHKMMAEASRAADSESDHADHLFRDRTQLMEWCAHVPDSWIQDACAIGSATECVETLQAFLDAGADEVAIYNASPAQCSEVIAAWRARAGAHPHGQS